MPNQTRSSHHDDRRPFPAFGDKGEVLNVRAEMTKRRGRMGALIDAAGRALAHPPFFILLALSHLLWVLLNVRIISGLEPWDPYPFVFLATIASVEAPFIATLVLMRQHRDERVAELREEINLQVSLHIEQELSVALRLLRELQQALNVQTAVEKRSLQKMQEPVDPEHLLDHLEKHLDETEGEGHESE